MLHWYDGSAPPEPYFVHVCLAAWWAGWSLEDTIVYMVLVIESPELVFQLYLTLVKQQEYCTLTAAEVEKNQDKLIQKKVEILGLLGAQWKTELTL